MNEATAATARRVLEGFAEIGSGKRLLPILAAEALVTKTGRPFDKGALHKLLVNRVYLGEALHKGRGYPSEHQASSPARCDRVHAILSQSPRTHAQRSRSQNPALLRGLLSGPDGRTMSPSHTRKKGKLYRYHVSRTVLQGGANDAAQMRLPAGEIEGIVMAHVRALLRQPEVVVGTWQAARAEVPGVTENEVREALARLDPLWDELFPAEQERIVRLLVERVDITDAGAEIRLNLEGIADLARDLGREAGGDRSITSVTVVVPTTVRRCGGRKQIIGPDGVPVRMGADGVEETRGDPVLVKALAPAFRWRRLLEEGRYASITEIAAAEKIERGSPRSSLCSGRISRQPSESDVAQCQAIARALSDPSLPRPSWHDHVPAAFRLNDRFSMAYWLGIHCSCR